MLLSAGTLIVGLFIYKRAKEKQFAAAVQKDDDEGIDPNWKHGAPIERSGPVDTHDSHRPSCQVWDDDIQLFVNSGDVDSDNSQQVCWQKNDDSKQPRYVDKDGNISFRTDDPFNEPPEKRGVCHFDSSGQDDTFPDIIAVAPPNRSERLCFASTGDPSEVPKYFVNSTTGQITFAPEYVADASVDGVGSLSDDYGVQLQSETDMTASFCEQKVPVVLTDGSLVNTWGNTAATMNLNTVDSCLDANLSPQTRFHDRKTKTLVYKNPFTGEKISTTYE